MLNEYSETYIPKYSYPVEKVKTHEDIHWKETEIKLIDDVEQWKRGLITKDQKSFIEQNFKLFTQSDVNVGRAYYDIFIPYFKNNEVRNMLGSFAAREGIHQRAYAYLNDTLGIGEDNYRAFLEYEEMVDKHEYMLDMSNKSMHDVGVSLAKQCFCEGISLFSSFALLLNFDRIGLLPGMSDVVRWSIRDESTHVEGNSWLFKQHIKEHPRIVNDKFKKEIYDCNKLLVKLEDRYLDCVFKNYDVFQNTKAPITINQSKQYLRAVADYRNVQLGLKPIYNVENPFGWIDELVNLPTQLNFFERDAVYSSDNFVGDWF